MSTDDAVAPADNADARIVLTRERRGWRDRARSYWIILDGEEVGTIKRGQRIEIPVAPGRHEMFMGIDWCTSPTLHLDVLPGDLIELWCAPGGSAAGGLVQVVAAPRSYIRLSRI